MLSCLARPRWCAPLVAALALLWLAAAPASANPKYAGIVVDVISGETLYSDQADAKRFPASLTKVMTLYIVFEELTARRLTLDSRLTVSKYAAARPPSKLGLKPGSTIKVRDAIKALVTKSANDVASVVAENIAGTEGKFARRMTETARRLGMKSTTFRNASGLPNPAQVTTARDMTRLGIAIQRDFPSYYGVFETRSFTFRKKRYRNHNRLLGQVKGVDGIKTGYIRASGFNLLTSVRRDGRHIVAVVMGGRTGASRNRHMTDLVGRTLPKAARGTPMAVAVWRDGGPPPRPARKPVLVASAPAAEPASIAVASADTPSGSGAIDGLLGYADASADEGATGALQAVIAQAGATGPAAAEPPANHGTSVLAVVAPDRGAATTDASRFDTAFASVSALAADGNLASLVTALSSAPDRATLSGSRTLEIGSQTSANQEGARGWTIQVGAVDDPARVDELHHEAEAVEPSLKARARLVTQTDGDNGPLYRARFAGFASQREAEAACKRFTHHNRPCWAVSM